MAAPVNSLDFKGVISDPTATLCGNFVATLLKLPVLLYKLVNWMLDTTGNFTAAFSKAITDLTLRPGDLIFSAGLLDTTGRLLCNGQAVLRATYADLFAAIGTTYGPGDGTTTFNVPDYRDAFPVGAGGSLAIGVGGGEATHKLIDAELGGYLTHKHITGRQQAASGGGDNDWCLIKATPLTDDDSLPVLNPSVGGSGASAQTLGAEAGAYLGTGPPRIPGNSTPTETTAHNNLPPFLACYIYVKI